MQKARALALPILPLLILGAREAHAASFDTMGELVPEPDATAFVDFEDDIFPPENPEGASLTQEDGASLHGKRVLALTPFAGVNVPVTVNDDAGQYRVSVWIRNSETIADVEVRYADNAHGGIDEIAALYPTGRMTSDGWVELANDHVRIQGQRGATVEVGFFSTNGSAIDALEIVRVGTLAPDQISGASCKGSGDPVCNEEEVCLFSQCRYVGGTVPSIPPDRDDVSAYLAARANLLFGPLLNRRLDLPVSNVVLERMRTTPSPWTYWNAFMLSIRRLHDGHTSTSGLSDFVLENERPLGLCFIEGDADLTHDVAPKDPIYLDVLVSHTATTRTLGLVAGDRLVAVDGQHPIAWARAQDEHHWTMSPTSNHRTFAEAAEALRSLIARYAHTITVIHCDSETLICEAPTAIDLTTVPVATPEEAFEPVACDNRPLRHLANSPVNHAGGGATVYHGLVNESDDQELIYGAEWESLYTSNGNDGVGAGLKAAVAAFNANARGVILDHRSGNGGTILGPDILWKWAVPTRPISAYFDRAFLEDEEPTIDVGLGKFQLAINSGTVDYAGSLNPTAMPIALLLTRDVSASDWLPLGIKGAAPNVKIFAPFETNGAFSTLYGFGYWLGMSFQMAVGDTFDATGQSRNGRGVPPDFVVLPKQSDLLIGVDTVYMAGLEWIRAQLETGGAL